VPDIADLDPTDADALAARVEGVRARMAEAAARVGRAPEAITLVGVSKTFPLAAVEAGYRAGLRHFGENRARELRDKARERPGAHAGGDLHWHMMGHLQTNKAKFVARHADRFDALDSPRLADALDGRAAKNDRVLPCLVQVNIAGASQKYGLAPDDVHAFLDHCARYEHLRIVGLMAIASLVDDPEAVRPEFQRMHDLFATYDAADAANVEMEVLSIGMTNDFEVAIEEGSTEIRLGRALFGPRD
jgi:hypothetical protein